MQVYLPTSSKSGRLRVEFYDLATTLLSGPIAFWLRDPGTLSSDKLPVALWYCATAAIAGVLMLFAFDLVIVAARKPDFFLTRAALFEVVSADGLLMATAHEDRTVKVWDAATAKLRVAYRGHAGIGTGVAIAPDGRTLASANGDGTVKVWPMPGR